MKRAINFIILLAMGVLTTSNTFGQDCKQIVSGGIYDIHREITNSERASSFVYWFSQKEYSSYQEAKTSSANAVVPIDGVLVGLGFSTDESGFQQFKKEIENYQSSQSYFKQKVETYVQTINKTVVDAWEKCITQAGMHFWTELTADPKTFIVCGRYIDDGGNKPYLKNFDFTPVGKINFSDGAFFFANGYRKKVLFTGATVSQAFTRADSSAITIVINSSRGEGLRTSLPKISKPVPYIRNFSASPNTITLGENSIISWDVVGATSININGINYTNAIDKVAIKPDETTTYKIVASNESGQQSSELTVTVNSIRITSADVTFLTNKGNGGDDKNAESKVTVTLKNANNEVAAQLFQCCGGTRFGNDDLTSGPFSMEVRSGAAILKQNIKHGNIVIHLDTGTDKWHMCFIIRVKFSDGTRLQLGWTSPADVSNVSDMIVPF